MKYQALFLLAIVAGQVLAGFPAKQSLQSRVAKVQSVSRTPVDSVKLDVCDVCVQFAGEFINELLNMVLNIGVVGSCGELCQLFEEKVNSSLAGFVCNLLCDYVGVKEFINIIEKADLDPIYYCELLKTCKVKDDGDATIKSVTVIPNKFPKESSFKIVIVFTTVNGTGTGEIDVDIDTVDGIPVGDSELMTPLQPGSYNLTISARASSSGCDPDQEICEQWLPGNYTVHVAICNGECGSKHPHSQVYDRGQAAFDITGSK